MEPLNFEYVLSKFDMNVCLVNDSPYLFSNMRIDRDTVPDGYYAYDVRDDDDCSGTFANIKEYVLVNHWGTIVGKNPLSLDKDGRYWCDEEDGVFIGENKYFTTSKSDYLRRLKTLQDEDIEIYFAYGDDWNSKFYIISEYEEGKLY